MLRLSLLSPGLLVGAALAIGCTTPPGESEAPVPELEPWARSFPGTLQGQSIASGSQGDVLLGGKFNDGLNFGGGLLLAEPEGSVFLAHLDAEGQHLFSGSTGASDALADVAIGPEGDLYVTGAFDGVINFGSGKLSGNEDGYLAAFTSGGVSDFSRSIGTEHSDRLYQVAATPAGNVVVSGVSGDDVDVGGGAPSVEYTTAQAIVVSYDRRGEYLWETRLDGYFSNTTAIAVDAAGQVAVGGTAYDGLVFDGQALPPGAFIAKLDSSGKPLWITLSSSSDGNIPSLRDVVAAPDGSTFVSGFYYGSLAFSGVSAPYTDNQRMFVLKLSPDGEPQYILSYGTYDYGGAPEIAVAPNGDLLLGMTSYENIDFGGGPVGGSGVGYDALLARFTADGVHVASTSLPGTGSRYLADLAVDPTGKVVAIGTFDATLTLGETVLTSENTNSAFVARIDF